MEGEGAIWRFVSDRNVFAHAIVARGNKFVAAFTRDLYSSLALRERRGKGRKGETAGMGGKGAKGPRAR